MNDRRPPALTPGDLSEHLARAGLDPRFQQMHWEWIGRFSNDVWRLDLDNGVRLIAKQPYGPPRSGEPPDAERTFYRFMAGRQDLPLPRFVADIGGTLLLEYQDLEPFSFRLSVPEPHAIAAIDALADWHAAWWQASHDAEWLPSYADVAVRRQIQTGYDRSWREHGPRLLEYVPEFELLGNALVGRLEATLAPMAAPATLIHGDAHAENIPLTPRGVVLLDWQDPRIANPGLDLAVFTTMSYRTRDRADWEHRLVDRHAERVRKRGCDWPDPRADYRLGLLRRVARIVEIADPEFVSLPWVFRRSAAAAMDHDVGELIR